MNTIKNNSGFTLIELILVIAILGIMAVAVMPQFVDIQASAQASQRDGTAASIRDGINLQYALDLADDGNGAFLGALDGAADGACTALNTCFDAILQQGIQEGWTKAGLVYTHDATGGAYTYDPLDGSFVCAGC